jgi:hypothetical protein
LSNEILKESWTRAGCKVFVLGQVRR